MSKSRNHSKAIRKVRILAASVLYVVATIFLLASFSFLPLSFAFPVPMPNNTWAGYVISTDNSKVTSVTGTLQVPQLPQAKGILLYWVGIDGFNNSMVEQCGIKLLTSITGDYAQYAYAFYQLFPSDSVNLDLSPQPTISAGDIVVFTVTVQSSTSIMFNIIDSTTSSQVTKIVPMPSYQGENAEWIGETPTFGTNIVSYDGVFPTATFSNCYFTMNGIQTSINGYSSNGPYGGGYIYSPPHDQLIEAQLQQVESQDIKCYTPSILTNHGQGFSLSNTYLPLSTPTPTNTQAPTQTPTPTATSSPPFITPTPTTIPPLTPNPTNIEPLSGNNYKVVDAIIGALIFGVATTVLLVPTKKNP